MGCPSKEVLLYIRISSKYLVSEIRELPSTHSKCFKRITEHFLMHKIDICSFSWTLDVSYFYFPRYCKRRVIPRFSEGHYPNKILIDSPSIPRVIPMKNIDEIL